MRTALRLAEAAAAAEAQHADEMKARVEHLERERERLREALDLVAEEGCQSDWPGMLTCIESNAGIKWSCSPCIASMALAPQAQETDAPRFPLDDVLLDAHPDMIEEAACPSCDGKGFINRTGVPGDSETCTECEAQEPEERGDG